MTDQAPLKARRDRLQLELTAAWARIARREARPEEIAAYYRKQAEYQMAVDLLAEEGRGTPGAPDPWPLCPECEGTGAHAVRYHFEYVPYEIAEYCPGCRGLGVLDDTNSRPVILGEYLAEWEEGQR